MICLIDFDCGHYAYLNIADDCYGLEMPADQWYHQFCIAEDQIVYQSPDNRSDMSEPCPLCEQYPQSLKMQTHRAHGDLVFLRTIMTSAKQQYLRWGARYFLLDISQKEASASDSRCSLAHDQFWVSRTPVSHDQFLHPVQECERMIDEAQDLLQSTTQSLANLRHIFAILHYVRFQVPRMLQIIADLDEAVTVVEQTQDLSHEKNGCLDEIANKQSIFTNSTLEQWLKRIGHWVINWPEILEEERLVVARKRARRRMETAQHQVTEHMEVVENTTDRMEVEEIIPTLDVVMAGA